jgi:hypothetical protein
MEFIICGDTNINCGPGSIVRITTGYGLGGPRIESRWGEIFRTCPDRPWGPPSLLYNGYQVFPAGKERPEHDADPSPLSSAVGHERVELYLYSPCGPYCLYTASVPVQGCILPCFIDYWTQRGCLTWKLQIALSSKGIAVVSYMNNVCGIELCSHIHLSPAINSKSSSQQERQFYYYVDYSMCKVSHLNFILTFWHRSFTFKF